MTNKAIIFDFDGTIADTLPVYINIYNDRLAPQFHLKQIDTERISLLKNKTMQEVFKSFNIPFLLIPFVVWKLKRIANKSIPKASLFPGMMELLNTLAAKNYLLLLVTSNSKPNVEKFFKKYQLDVFSEISSSRNFFNKSKNIKSVMKKYALKPDEVIYVGDEVRDIVSSRKAGIRIISVNWGYSTSALLAGYKPDYLLDRPEELLSTILNLNKPV